jgi:hypothetical protein
MILHAYVSTYVSFVHITVLSFLCCPETLGRCNWIVPGPHWEYHGLPQAQPFMTAVSWQRLVPKITGYRGKGTVVPIESCYLRPGVIVHTCISSYSGYRNREYNGSRLSQAKMLARSISTNKPVLWLTSVILATQKECAWTKTGHKHKTKTLTTTTKITKAKRTGNVAQMAECLPCKHKALSSTPVRPKGKKWQKERCCLLLLAVLGRFANSWRQRIKNNLWLYLNQTVVSQ